MNLELTISEDAGLDAEQSQRVKQEVAWALQTISGVAGLESVPPSTSLKVRVVEDFATAVRAATRELTGVEEQRPEREAVVPVGQHLAVSDASGLRCIVLLYAGFWRHEASEACVSRLVTSLHEFGHFVIFLRRFASGIAPPLRGSHEAALARQIWEECAVDTLVDETIRSSRVFMDDLGNALGLRETQIEGLMESAMTLMPRFREWVLGRVQQYRVTGGGLELILPEFWARQTELFTILAHLVGAFRSGDQVAELHSHLESAEGFGEYMSGSWDRLVQGLCAEEAAAPALLEACLKEFSRSAGLNYEGGYLHVSRPNGVVDPER
jgi:hypothetical protein